MFKLIGKKIFTIFAQKVSISGPIVEQGTYSRSSMRFSSLLHDVAPGSDIKPCNKIDKPLAVYRLSNVT